MHIPTPSSFERQKGGGTWPLLIPLNELVQNRSTQFQLRHCVLHLLPSQLGRFGQCADHRFSFDRETPVHFGSWFPSTPVFHLNRRQSLSVSLSAISVEQSTIYRVLQVD